MWKFFFNYFIVCTTTTKGLVLEIFTLESSHIVNCNFLSAGHLVIKENKPINCVLYYYVVTYAQRFKFKHHFLCDCNYRGSRTACFLRLYTHLMVLENRFPSLFSGGLRDLPLNISCESCLNKERVCSCSGFQSLSKCSIPLQSRFLLFAREKRP